MKIIDSLKFVKNGYDKTNKVPNLAHYVIKNKRITAFDGTIVLSSPIQLDLDIAPVALHFHKCIEACKETVGITVEKDKIRIKSGGFKSLVRCLPTNEIPTIIPIGKEYNLPDDFIDTLKVLNPLIETEAPSQDRMYVTGLSFIGSSVVATNNIVFAEKWLGDSYPNIKIPKRCVVELVKYGKPILKMLDGDDMVFFFYDDTRYIGCKKLVCEHPNFHKVLDRPSEQQTPPDGFWEALDTVQGFADETGRVEIHKGMIVVKSKEGDEESSCEFTGLDDLENPLYFNVNNLLKIKHIVNTMEFEYGKPALFYGDKIRGAIVGYRG